MAFVPLAPEINMAINSVAGVIDFSIGDVTDGVADFKALGASISDKYKQIGAAKGGHTYTSISWS